MNMQKFIKLSAARLMSYRCNKETCKKTKENSAMTLKQYCHRYRGQ